MSSCSEPIGWGSSCRSAKCWRARNQCSLTSDGSARGRWKDALSRELGVHQMAELWRYVHSRIDMYFYEETNSMPSDMVPTEVYSTLSGQMLWDVPSLGSTWYSDACCTQWPQAVDAIISNAAGGPTTLTAVVQQGNHHIIGAWGEFLVANLPHDMISVKYNQFCNMWPLEQGDH